MPYDHEPSGSELEAALIGWGFTVPATLQDRLDAIQSGANADFDRDVKRRMLAPWQGPTSARTLVTEMRAFNPPVDRNRTLLLGRHDMCADPTSIVYVPFGATAQTLQQGVNYASLPANAPYLADPRPYRRIQFFWNYSWREPLYPTQISSLQITSTWAAYQMLPDDAFEAKLARGALKALNAFRMQITGGLQRWSEIGGVSEDYGPKPLAWTAEDAQEIYDRAVRHHRLVTLGS